MQREMTCIVCPMGCLMTVRSEGDNIIVTGNTCIRGKIYGEQELLRPMRTVTASVSVVGGNMPLLSVKTKEAVPKDSIDAILSAIYATKAVAPVEIGTVIVSNVANTGVDVTATRHIDKA